MVGKLGSGWMLTHSTRHRKSSTLGWPTGSWKRTGEHEIPERHHD